MDVFQLIGDFLHLVAILLLLLKILASKNVVGLSYKTQEMFLIVFLTRYSDIILEHHWGSLYFNIMRIIFIIVNSVTIYYMRFKRPFKLVLLDLYRVMMLMLIHSHIIICTQLPLCLGCFYTRDGQSMEYFKHFHGGFKPLRYYLSFI